MCFELLKRALGLQDPKKNIGFRLNENIEVYFAEKSPEEQQ